MSEALPHLPPLTTGRKADCLIWRWLIGIGVLTCASNVDVGPAMAAEPSFHLRSHDLTVHLFPRDHRIQAIDRMTVQARMPGQDRLVVTLNPSLRIDRVSVLTPSGSRPVSIKRSDAAEANVSVQLPAPVTPGQVLIFEWEYGGLINEPPKEPRHLRFVTPSETAGHIGDEGVYLSGETQWYPDVQGDLPTYRIAVTVPQGWQSVSHGRQIEQAVTTREGQATLTQVWDSPTRTEALTLVANRFVKGQRDWKGIEIATYLFPEDAALSDEYLDAAIRYLEVYVQLLGPYPFPKFAVVENFFASGLGMPSFTLLGSGIIKRHYVQPYALGHEVVHSWFGNSVFNDPAKGNWVEGLTTYLANYYYDELKGTTDQAREHRRLMLLGYAVYVRPDEDYPVDRFTRKSDQKDNAIGYQKAAMIFHMLRGEVGEEAFWSGIKRLVEERTGTYATWPDLERIFARTANRDLRWFFQQWVEQVGSPEIRIEIARVRPDARPGAPDGFLVEMTLAQRTPLYRLRLPVSLALADGRKLTEFVELTEARQAFSFHVPSRPIRLNLDPDWAVFRRIERTNIPPMLNLFVTDLNRIVVTPSEGEKRDRTPYEELAERLMARAAVPPTGSSSGIKRLLDREVTESEELTKTAGSVLVLGPPGMNRAAEWAARQCGNEVSIGRGRVTVQGRTYDRPDHAFLLSCRNPDHPGHVVTLFYGHSPEAAAKVGRLLFFYGWQSYLVFQDGAVIARGDFSHSSHDLEVDLK